MREHGTISRADAEEKLANWASFLDDYCPLCADALDRARETLD
jgi:hypothetical protein